MRADLSACTLMQRDLQDTSTSRCDFFPTAISHSQPCSPPEYQTPSEKPLTSEVPDREIPVPGVCGCRFEGELLAGRGQVAVGGADGLNYLQSTRITGGEVSPAVPRRSRDTDQHIHSTTLPFGLWRGRSPFTLRKMASRLLWLVCIEEPFVVL